MEYYALLTAATVIIVVLSLAVYRKTGLTDLSAVIVTVHVVAVPTHAPFQPANVAPASGVAVSVTTVPLA